MPPSGEPVKITSTSLALSGSGCGERSGAICQVNTIRRGTSQAITRPQWIVKPWVKSSKARSGGTSTLTLASSGFISASRRE